MDGCECGGASQMWVVGLRAEKNKGKEALRA